MSNPQRKPGAARQSLVRVDTQIGADQNQALNDLVRLTGVSKSSLIRSAIAQMLSAAGALPPDAAEVAPTPTRGPGLASQRGNR